MMRILLPLLLRCLAATWRLRVAGSLPDSPAIVAFWHDEMLPIWKLFSKRDAVGLTSKSRDGGLLAALLWQWKYTVVRGSSSRHGKEALEEVVRYAHNHVVLMTPDGPRGPRHELKPGAVVAAHRAGVPLYLCTVQARGIRLQKSWDRFLVPLPFAAVDITLSLPITVPADATREDISALIRQCERVLNRL